MNTEDKDDNVDDHQIQFRRSMKICNEMYVLIHQLGEGNFGSVFLAINNPQYKKYRSDKFPNQVAIKLEREKPGIPSQIQNETNLLHKLHEEEVINGFPVCYESGYEKGYHFMVFKLLGPSLGDLLKLCGGKFSLRTAIYLGTQMFSRLETVHRLGYIYRDIKPQNFLMGIGFQSSVLYLVDFGLIRKYCDEKTKIHRPYKEDRQFNGNLRFASICSHLKIEQSRRDDLESLCYLLIYLIKGELPWQNIKNQSGFEMKEKWIMQKKIKTTPEELCEGLPIQFRNILEYCLSLNYDSDPDYRFIEGEMRSLLMKYCDINVVIYDWMTLDSPRSIEREKLTIKISPCWETGNQEGQESKTVKVRERKHEFLGQSVFPSF